MRIRDWSSDVCSSDLGAFAERTAEKYGFTREAQDAFAIESLKRAKQANEDGSFEFEIVNVEVSGKKGTETISRDEQPFKAMPEKIPTLKPAFKKDGPKRKSVGKGKSGSEM